MQLYNEKQSDKQFTQDFLIQLYRLIIFVCDWKKSDMDLIQVLVESTHFFASRPTFSLHPDLPTQEIVKWFSNCSVVTYIDDQKAQELIRAFLDSDFSVDSPKNTWKVFCAMSLYALHNFNVSVNSLIQR